ncbi:MAG: hypothetical protein FIB08_02040 [Candidatus Methanoperedens sp.]|nr:hypothetical protein [Candidatus Methanoperedens sp.]
MDRMYASLERIVGIEDAIKMQRDKLNSLREAVKTLKYKKIDIAGDYASITYKAIDGGCMKINLNPFEINLVDVADSNGNIKLSFVVPQISGYGDIPEQKQTMSVVIENVDNIPVIKKFTKLLNVSGVSDISYILNDSNGLMEIAEWACIFDRVTSDSDEPIIILKDGLLRSKVLKSTHTSNYITILKKILKEKKKYVKLVGVSKTSAILSLISTAIFLEKKIPSDSIGYIKIPLELELKAYKWSGSGLLKTESSKPLDYAFGDIYIVKLSKNSNLLVTLEIPKDFNSGEPIYSEGEIEDIISYLAKDSRHSYPVLGYPQTIMRAHEVAVRLGFPSSIIKDEIKDKILSGLERDASDFIRDGWLLIDFVDKGVLGGGKYD